jgi:sec-independent protein translocase protein TatA
MLENVGGTELLLILFVLFIFFGPKKLPSLGKSLGRGVKEFKNAMRSVKQDVEKASKVE